MTILTTRSRAFRSPMYIQGPGEFDMIPEYIAHLGKNPYILVDPFLFPTLGIRIKNNLEKNGFTCMVDSFGKECSEEEANRVRKVCVDNGVNVMIGIGGGKTLDTVKWVANMLSLPFINVPTAASTDAPTSALSVVYSPEGEHLRCECHKRGADIVLVDSEIILHAPKRLFVAGVGDALSTLFEAKANQASGHVNEVGKGYMACQLGMAVAELCYRVIIDQGRQAKADLEKGICSESFENVIEANTLLSGLGFENTGEAAAHGIHSGLTAIPATNAYYHGEKVAFGTICELVLEKKDKKLIDEVISFCYDMGLPITLADIGVESTEETIRCIAEKTAANHLIYAEPCEITADVIFGAVSAANALGTEYKKKMSGTKA